MSKSKSPWPKHGLSGKVHAAKTHAEREGIDASDRQIMGVGYRAWNDGRNVADVWREVLNE